MTGEIQGEKKAICPGARVIVIFIFRKKSMYSQHSRSSKCYLLFSP